MNHRIWVCLFSLFLLTSLFAAEPHPAKSEILVPYSEATAGQSFHLGWKIKLQPGWHVYWVNPGDSGSAPQLISQNEIPGVTVSPMEWPVPLRIDLGPLTNFGYEREVIFPFEVTIAPQTAFGDVNWKALGKWLVCQETCIPGEAQMVARFKIGEKNIATSDRFSIQQAVAALPTNEGPKAKVVLRPNGYEISAAWEGRTPGDVDFFPLRRSEVSHADRPKLTKSDQGWSLLLTPDSTLSAPLSRLEGLLVFSTRGVREGQYLSHPFNTEANHMFTTELFRMALFAFLGGLILNLMPCVFPVLSIKILGFVEQAGQSKKKLRLHGWVFTLGVMLSFWALTAVIIGFRTGGQKLGWGFQLQSPLFLVFLSSLLLFMSLNLLGLFDVGTRMMGMGSSLASKEGYSGSFFSGILATIVATPCTAPFMGTALGFAFSQPIIVSFIILSALGFGMALPYLLLTYSPALLHRLPRPGAWMQTLKQLMAFPLLATVIWLVWVFGKQSGIDSVLTLLFAFLFFSLAVFLWSLTQHLRQGSEKSKVVGRLFAILALGSGLYFAVGAAGINIGSPKENENTYPVTFVDFDEQKIEAYRKEGKAVFLDFTAAWCVSCQVNEKLVFGSLEVRKKFHDQKIIAMKADWTNGDQKITDILTKYHRSGIPFYLLYEPLSTKPPRELPEVLTPAILLNALAELSPK